jgi:two-component system chemotaxis response regulator CheB
MFAKRLNDSTSLVVKEAQTGDFLEQGKVLIAPGDKHMSVKKVENR